MKEEDLELIESNFLRDYLAAESDQEKHDLLLGAISAHLLVPTIQRRLAAEVPTGLTEEGEERMFRHRSEIIDHFKNLPDFSDLMQVMIDIDGTLFPVDRAVRELGVDLPASKTKTWGEGGDHLSDLILLQLGHDDLLYDRDLTEAESQKRKKILKGFFDRIHTDQELLKRAGVFEYAPGVIRELRQQGIRVHIITHRSAVARPATLAWLEAMEIEYDYFACDDSSRLDKISYCKENSIPVLLDDKPSTIRKARQRGIEAISLAWPYSQKALEESGGDEALCWREMAHQTLAHIERLVLDRAREKSLLFTRGEVERE